MENSSTKEIWRSISVAPNYQVSDKGRIKNSKGEILSPSVNSSGYLCLALFTEGVKTSHTVHSLVAQTFLGHVPNKWVTVVNHINGIKTDNRIENLELVSQRVNCHKANRKNKTSKYVGVSYVSSTKKWAASIRYDSKKLALGSYALEDTAAKIYQLALSIINNNLLTDKLSAIDNLKAEYNEKKKKKSDRIVEKHGKKATTYQVYFQSKYVGTFKTFCEANRTLGMKKLLNDINLNK